MSIDTAADANNGGSGISDSKSPLRRWIMLLFSFLFVAGISSLATASQPIFAISKNFCAGAPSASSNAESCTLATQVAQGDPVYYVISITSPWGQPQQVVDLIDQYPVGFVPTAGGLFCEDNLGNPVPANSSALPNGIAQVTLNMAQTIHCFVPGTFQDVASTPAPNDDTGNKKNTVQGKNKDGYNPTADVQTTVLQTNPLGTDLSVTKSSSGAIDVTSGSGTITYTITITNNGPDDVDIGDWFTLHDNLSLPPSSVPFNVEYVGSGCVVNASGGSSNSNAATDCLDPNGPNLVNGTPVFVGTMAPKPFFNWGFASGTGHINAGESITLTITVEVSQLKGIDCYAALNADGLRNAVFFTLINPKDGSAFADGNPSNNTATVTTGITTGQTIEDPDCGTSHLRITKKQIDPIPVTNQVGWGTPVTYEIRIQNVSVPNQAITIKKTDMQDWITEGINTPPFYRQHVVTKCVASSPGAVCTPFAPGINVGANPYQYSYYGHTDKAWDNSAPVKLPANGDWVTFHTTFEYVKPDCETVPNANPKPIFNTVKVRYMAAAFGSSATTPQNVVFNQEATAQTNMRKQPPCKFLVTKTLQPNSPTTVKFNFPPMQYIVSFTNLGNPRTVGTLMDVGRISIPNYATSMPFNSTWSCTKSAGVTGNGPLVGSNSLASLNYTATPAMGAPVILNLGNNVYFPTNGNITCNVSVWIKRPPFNDPYCTTDDAYFENMAMMDVTNPFNTNIFWPAAGTILPGSMTQPVPQNRNWAMTRNMLPKCWDAHVQKSATVSGLPANTPAWTYAGNTNAVNFKITTTNDADSILGTATAPPSGWVVTDTVTHTPSIPVPTPAYSNANNQQGSPVCTLLGWCWSSALPNDGKKQIGIKSLAPGANGIWNIKSTGPWKSGINIKNCAQIKPVGDRTGADWYDNRANDPNRLKSCVDVPVIETTKIEVRKQVIDQTGAGVTAMGAFGFSVACSPYAIPTSATTNFNLSTNSSGYSSYQAVTPVAKYGTCVITETSKPAIPVAMVRKCGGVGNVLQSSNSPVTLTSLASVNNQVTVTNTYKCKPLPNTGNLEVIKEVTNTVPGVLIPPQTYPITVSCAPATGGPATVTQLPLSGWPGASGMVNNIPVGSNCTVTEQTPSTPAILANMCANQGKTFQWDPPVYVPASGSTTIAAGVNVVRVKNTWSCVGGSTTLTVTKRISNPGSFVLTNMNFSVTANCTPGGINAQAVNNGSGMGSVGFTVPVGAICTVTENTPLPTFPAAADQSCGPGKKAAWKPPFVGPNNGTVTVGASGAQVFVTNAWECVPDGTAQLEIIKSFTTPALPVPWPQTMWTINANCNPAASQNVVNINTNSSSGTTITGSNANPITVPIGATCIIVEPAASLPVFSSAMSGIISTTHCGGTGHPEWNSPTYTYNGQTTATPPTITAAAGVNTVRVNNSWSCVPNTPAGNQLEILKSVQGPPFTVAVPPAFSADYVIESNCSTASTPTSVSLTAVSNGGGDSDMFTVQSGANCNLTEPVMPAFPTTAYTYCTNFGNNGVPIWEAPTYSPSSNITGGPNLQTVNVLNKWKCVMNHPWILSVIKTVQGPAGAPTLPVLPYVITRNCTGVAANGGTPTGTATINTATTSVATNVGGLVTVGAHCTLSEVQPPLPQSAQTYCDTASPGSMAKWNDPVYSLPMPIAGDFPANNKTVTVTNSWYCLSSAKVAPKKKKKPKFKINIGIGIGGGGGGDNPKPRQPRDVPNGP